jgi:hypothetical protein
MKKIFIGSSPVSSIAGYALAALMIIQDMTSAGETNWTKIAIAVLIAVLGRVVKDSDGKTAA